MLENDITLKVAASATDLVINEGYDVNYGARPLKRAIQRKIEDVLSDEIISSRISRGDTVTIYAENGKIGYAKSEVK